MLGPRLDADQRRWRRRALRPGGALSFACWQGVFANEWMLIPGAAVAEVTGSLPPMPGPDEPGPFSLADPARVRAVLGAAGFGAIAINPPLRSRGDQ